MIKVPIEREREREREKKQRLFELLVKHSDRAQCAATAAANVTTTSGWSGVRTNAFGALCLILTAVSFSFFFPKETKAQAEKRAGSLF